MVAQGRIRRFETVPHREAFGARMEGSWILSMTSSIYCDGLRALVTFARYSLGWKGSGASQNVCEVRPTRASADGSPASVDVRFAGTGLIARVDADGVRLTRPGQEEVRLSWNSVRYPLPDDHMPVIQAALYGDRQSIHSVDFGSEGWGVVQLPALLGLWLLNSVIKARTVAPLAP